MDWNHIRLPAKLVGFLVILPIGGCALLVPSTLVSRDELTLPQALDTVACSLATFRNANSKYGNNPGTMLDQVKVTLALKASADGTSTLAVDTRDVFPIGLTYNDALQQTRSRDNTIEITFRNVYTVGLNKAGESVVKTQGPPLNNKSEVPVIDPCIYQGQPFDPAQFQRDKGTANVVQR